MDSEQQRVVFSCCCAVGCLLFLILFPLGWSVLEPTEYGIEMNTVSKTANYDRTYGAGRYFLGVGNEFLRFPSTLQVIDFSPDSQDGAAKLTAGTADGQFIEIEVSIYYRIIKDNVISLYRFAGLDYQSQLIARAQDALKNTAIKFSTLEYFTRREDIADKMLSNVAIAMDKMNVTCELLQLRNIGLPNKLEAALIQKVVKQQEKNTADATEIVELVRAKTEFDVAEGEAEITRIKGEANAAANLVREVARAEGTRIITQVQKSSLNLLRDSLNFTNVDLLQYLYYTRKIRTGAAGQTILVGMNNGVVQLSTAGST